MRVPALVLVLALALLAGCFNKDTVPDGRTFSASGGQVSPGWAYDGAGLAPGSATLSGSLLDSANTGSVNVAFEFGGARYVATFDTFAQGAGKEFMDGGIEFELDEHGDTGVADASIPKIRAKVAAWGSAKVERDMALATPEPWSAHLMLSADTVRGTDGKIAKADGTTPYDPAAPADARRIEGDPQAIFWVKHPQGETFARPPGAAFANLSCQAPQCVVTAEIALADVPPAGTPFTGNVTFRPDGQLPVAAARGAVLTITDANGTEIARATSDVVAGPDPTIVPLAGEFPAGLVAPLTVTLAGDGAFGASVDLAFAFSDVPFLVVTWDEYVLEDA